MARTRRPVDETTISAGGQRVTLADGQVRAQRALTAAAMSIDIADRKVIKRLKSQRQDWQDEAWECYDGNPLVGFASDFTANAMSRLRFFIGWQPDVSDFPAEVKEDAPPEGMPAETYAEATAILTRLDQGQGLMEMARKAAYGLTLPGELYVLGREEVDPITGVTAERFDAYSTSELDLSKVESGTISIKTAPGNDGETIQIDPETAVFFRVWRPHPRFGQLASTPMRRVLEQCEEQALLRRYMRGASRSRLNAGVFLVPEEWELGPKHNQREGETQGYDRLGDEMVEAFATGIESEASAANVVPYVLHAKADTLDKAKLITFGRDFDALALEMRQRLDEEIATGLDLPDQVLLGLGDVKFRNAEVITQEQFKLHLEPLAIVWVRALTIGFLIPMLEEAGVPSDIAGHFTIWYDSAAVTSQTDQTASSNFGYDRELLSGQTWRQVNNYTEEDAPDEDEKAERQAAKPQLLPVIPGHEGFTPSPGDQTAKSPFDRSSEKPAGDQAAALVQALGRMGVHVPVLAVSRPALTAAAGPKQQRVIVARLGRRLAQSESSTRLKVQLAADQAMRRAFEKMGAATRQRAGKQSDVFRLLAGVDNQAICSTVGLEAVVRCGVNPAAHLDAELAKLHGRFIEVVAAHQHKVVGLVASATRRAPGPLIERSATSWAAGVEHAWSELYGRLHKLAGDELFLAMVAAAPRQRPVIPIPEGEAAVFGEFDATVSVPAGLIREMLSIAGGITVPDEGDPETMGGVIGGPIMDDLFAEVGLDYAGDDDGGGYEWLYGDSSTRTKPFEPHEALDGMSFSAYDDPVLTNEEGFPDGAFYFPGDHAYCQCEVAPRLVETVPAVVDPVAPSTLRARGLTEAPAAEAEATKLRTPGYPGNPPVPVFVGAEE